jgi:hypothetical protein
MSYEKAFDKENNLKIIVIEIYFNQK